MVKQVMVCCIDRKQYWNWLHLKLTLSSYTKNLSSPLCQDLTPWPWPLIHAHLNLVFIFRCYGDSQTHMYVRTTCKNWSNSKMFSWTLTYIPTFGKQHIVSYLYHGETDIDKYGVRTTCITCKYSPQIFLLNQVKFHHQLKISAIHIYTFIEISSILFCDFHSSLKTS